MYNDTPSDNDAPALIRELPWNSEIRASFCRKRFLLYDKFLQKFISSRDGHAKSTDTGGKQFLQNFISSTKGSVKSTETTQGRYENMQEDYWFPATRTLAEKKDKKL